MNPERLAQDIKLKPDFRESRVPIWLWIACRIPVSACSRRYNRSPLTKHLVVGSKAVKQKVFLQNTIRARCF